MSIVIKGVEMPKESWECPCHNGETGRCKVTGRSCCDIPKDCPLVEIQTPSRMSDDTISRQAAIDAVTEGLKGIFVEYRDIAEKMIGKLPTADPEPKTGKWIKIKKHHYGTHHDFDYYTICCSACGDRPEKAWHLTAYCPNCGSRMLEDGGEDDE